MGISSYGALFCIFLLNVYMKKKFVIVSTCQGPGIFVALQTVQNFVDEYEMVYFANYQEFDPRLIDALKVSDVLLYQAINDTYNQHNIMHLTKYLPATTKVISFPYIYCNWLWTFFAKNGSGEFFDDGVIANLLTTYDPETLLSKFVENQLPFDLQSRKDKSMSILKAREATTDIKVHDYIEAHYKHIRLFNINNHPSHHLLIHCANQVLEIMGMSDRIQPDIYIGVYNDTKFWPVSPIVQKELVLDYCDDMTSFYEDMLLDHLNGNSLVKYFNNFKDNLYAPPSYQ